jgi:hypothetical protein
MLLLFLLLVFARGFLGKRAFFGVFFFYVNLLKAFKAFSALIRFYFQLITTPLRE